MKDEKKKEVSTGADTDEEISVHNGLRSNPPLKKENNYAGDSVDGHKKLEAANEIFAEKEISQTFNNS
ncbi:hypothetical protein ACFQ3N_04845 [Virgibacillus byunsanensis]|uniref:DUF4025 domain-containing protein n=1 Tax=Virgibacillus byunsanensis TaxID=570945 RepID=A0ABW3LI69_9BACI